MEIKDLGEYQYEVKESSFVYLMKVSSFQEEVYISIENKTDSLLSFFKYQEKFSVSDLHKKNDYFAKYASSGAIKDEIHRLILAKALQLQDKRTNINLIFSLESHGSLMLIIPEESFNQKEILTSLVYSISDIQRKNEALQKENSELKETIVNLEKEAKERLSEISEMKTKLDFVMEYLEKEKDRKYEKLEGDIETSSDIVKEVKELQLLCNWIAPCQKLKTKLLYKVSRDGDKAETFHKLCDNKGPTIVLIKTSTNRFGGYASVGWESEPTYKFKTDSEAFIFTLDLKKKYKTTNPDCSIYCSTVYGPGFGDGCDLIVDDNCTTSQLSHTNVPCTYKIEKDFELSGGQRNFVVEEMEVYQIIFN